MIAMFRSSLRNLRGIERSASATSFSNASRCTGRSFRNSFRLWALSFQFGFALFRNDVAVIVAVVADDALVAERLRLADAAAVEDQRILGARPALRRHRGAELLLDRDRVVAFGDANPVGHSQHVAIDRQPRYSQ